MSERNATFKVTTHSRVVFLAPNVAPRVDKTAKANSCFVSLLVSLNSEERFSGLSCWKHFGFSLVYNTPPSLPPPAAATVSELHSTPGSTERDPGRQHSLADTGQFLCAADDQRTKGVASTL